MTGNTYGGLIAEESHETLASLDTFIRFNFVTSSFGIINGEYRARTLRGKRVKSNSEHAYRHVGKMHRG